LRTLKLKNVVNQFYGMGQEVRIDFIAVEFLGKEGVNCVEVGFFKFVVFEE
jgi:hypothetical protein